MIVVPRMAATARDKNRARSFLQSLRAHLLGKSRYQALRHGDGRFGSDVARTNSRPTGRENQICFLRIGSRFQKRSDGITIIWQYGGMRDLPAEVPAAAGDGRPRTIFVFLAGYGITDGKDCNSHRGGARDR